MGLSFLLKGGCLLIVRKSLYDGMAGIGWLGDECDNYAVHIAMSILLLISALLPEPILQLTSMIPRKYYPSIRKLWCIQAMSYV